MRVPVATAVIPGNLEGSQGALDSTNTRTPARAKVVKASDANPFSRGNFSTVKGRVLCFSLRFVLFLMDS